MKTLYILCFVLLLFSFPLASQTIVNGQVSGEWTKEESPYIVTGDLVVPVGESLTVSPGTTIRWKPHTDPLKFVVSGTLFLLGTADDSIIFLPDQFHPTAKDYGTIVLDTTGNLRIEQTVFPFNNPIIEGTGKSVHIVNSRFFRASILDMPRFHRAIDLAGTDTVRIVGSKFDGFGNTGSCITHSATKPPFFLLEECTINNFTLKSIHLLYSATENQVKRGALIIRNSTIDNTNSPIVISAESLRQWQIEGNRVTNCSGDAIQTTISRSTLTVTDNDLTDVRCAFVVNVPDAYPVEVTIYNNRVENCSQVASVDGDGKVGTNRINIHNNTFVQAEDHTVSSKPNGTTYVMNNIFVVPSGLCGTSYLSETEFVRYNLYWSTTQPSEITFAEHSLFADPKFVGEKDYRLQPDSPAIDRGNPAYSIGDEPKPNGGRINIGAYGGTLLATPTPEDQPGTIFVPNSILHFHATTAVDDTLRLSGWFRITNYGYRKLTIHSYSLSDSVNFYMTGGMAVDVAPFDIITNQLPKLYFTPKRAGLFEESLILHSSDGDFTVPIRALAQSGTLLPASIQGCYRLTAENSPYLVNKSYRYKDTDTLIVDPGVTVTFLELNSASISVGTLLAIGTPDAPVVINAGQSRYPVITIDVANARLEHIRISQLFWLNFTGLLDNSEFVLRDFTFTNVDYFWKVFQTINLLPDKRYNIVIERGTVHNMPGFEIVNGGTQADVKLRNVQFVNTYLSALKLRISQPFGSLDVGNNTFVQCGSLLEIFREEDSLSFPTSFMENSIIMDCNGLFEGVRMNDVNLKIRNALLWGNEQWGAIPIEYVDSVQADPLFAGSPNHAYAPTAGSPAIDAGFSDSPLDPDGSRADIGARWFNHNNRPAEVHRLQPEAQNLTCPAGSTLCFIAGGTDPDNDILDYLWMVGDSTFWANSTVDLIFNMTGEQIVAVRVFDGYELSPATNWRIRVSTLAVEPEPLPHQFAITALYPNPFNSILNLQYTLPGTGVVELAMYDIQGRTILHNHDIHTMGGTVTRVLDFSRYSEGIYFLRLQYGGRTEYRKLLYIK